ncbi:MAG: 16S rRNA (cytidine(1402)-2'-O)-methyltransferase [Angustibacter sp.]
MGRRSSEDRNGLLVVAATPIGDPRDASPRLVDLLASADLVAAEDTRRLSRLALSLGVEITGRVLSHHEHNESKRTAHIVEALRAGATVAVVTDAGMPSVSDPGYRLVSAAIEAGVRVSAVPGPSAVLTALAVSGLPVDRFCFEGFLPRRAGERDRVLAALATERRTLVFFEAPHRLPAMLAALAAAFGAERLAAVCRELTKTYEQVRRGPVEELADWASSDQVRGEVTVVVAGAPSAPADPAHLMSQVRARVADGLRLKDAVAEVASVHGVPKRGLYETALTEPTVREVLGRVTRHGNRPDASSVV